ncbi:MAG: biotin/lipoyl-containing protein, partial [Pseudomonadota bacterium]
VDSSDGLRADRFYFMEMNTRLQVEHPVTEAITGIDLVEWQLRVAAGAPLPVTQEEVTFLGHAFEARLYAEDVPAGFLPATGWLTHLAFPEDARVDTGVRASDEISPFYDPMIAKLTVHGETRAAALSKLRRALAGTQIAGATTNLAFLSALARHNRFVRGDVDTGLIERDMDALTAVPTPCSRTIAIAAVETLGAKGAAFEGFSLWAPLEQTVELAWDGAPIVARVASLGQGRYLVRRDAAEHEVLRQGADWRVDGVAVAARSFRHDREISVFWGNSYHFIKADPLARETGVAASADATLAPMPGLVKAVFVSDGDEVAEGDRLAVLEAMKMEHVLRAGRAGRVASVVVAEGAQIAAGDLMVRLEPDDAG